VSSQAAMVELEFRHPEGWLVDAFSWPVPGRAADVRAAVRAKSHPAEVALTGDGELAASGSETWLKSWPRLHVLDANRPLDRLPLPQVDCLRAKARPDGIVTVPLVGEGWEGWLSAGAAGTETVFSYECIYQGPESFDAHEIGLAFDLPRTLSDLWWHRIADWTAYPAGHIGRPRGYARSAPAPANPLHPAGRWEDDTTEAGTNDYRSAKRAILAAGVTDGAASVSVLSDGVQHIRASLVNGAPRLHVLDWYGGVPFRLDTDHIWTSNFGTGHRIARGTKLQGKVVMTWGSLPPEARDQDRAPQSEDISA
ncbi:MAG TPA: hypothetical protein VHA07_10285, partial [Devosia sp.]|nr:hypothetical protein [Devosia sp.]